MSSPTLRTRAMLRKIQSFNKNRVFRVAVIGQKGVGKSALTVRFLTRRFIGDYDSTSEKTYTYTHCILGNSVDFEILDTAGQYDNSSLKQHVRWSDAVVLVYSVTDRCSFNEARRLHFTITASCRRRYKPASDPSQEFPPPPPPGTPVTLVGNQRDREAERMVSGEEGAALAAELGCLAFTELSVREDVEPVLDLFHDLFLDTRRRAKAHKPPAKARGAVSWSRSSLERLALTLSRGDREREEGADSSDGAASCPPSPALRARRREALVS